MAKIRKGDLVEVIRGASKERGGDKGKQGTVLSVLTESDRVIVEGVNFVSRHTKRSQGENGAVAGGIETVEAPIHVSRVAVVDPETKKPTRVGFRIETGKDGKSRKVRVAKKSGKDL